MTSLAFTFQGRTVRTAGTPDAPLFVAADVCGILGLGNTTEAIRNVPEAEKTTLRISEGGPEVNVLRESGLYRVIFRSSKTEAEAFRAWVFNDVLPAIRKTGRYEIAPAALTIPQTYAAALRAAADLADENAGLKRTLAEQAPAVALAARIETDAVDLTLTAVAKILGWKRDDLAAELIKRRFLYRLDGRLTPKSEYGEHGQRLFLLKMTGPKGGALYPNLVITAKSLDRVAKELGVVSFQQPLRLLPPASEAA